jgi:endonuclease/exonuclease/phosphatase family metal-dependent hydrolase
MRCFLGPAFLAAAISLACGPAPETKHETKSTHDAAPEIDAGVEAGLDAGFDAAGDTGSVEKVLRVGTFNVHLFFDTVCDSGKCGAGDFEQAPSQAELDARADLIANAIRSLSADVVSLQEIETQVSMNALSSRLKDLYPTAIFAETGAPGSVDVAVLGAGKFLEARKHRYYPMVRPDGTSTYFAREFLEVHMELDGRRVILFSAHFRSKANDDPGRRLAEAQAAHEIVIASAKEFPDATVVLGGDLNDTPGSEPIEALESDSELLRVAKDKPLSEQGTYNWNGEAQAIDHVFLAASSRGLYVPGSASVMRDHPSGGLADSDHAALIADFGVR